MVLEAVLSVVGGEDIRAKAILSEILAQIVLKRPCRPSSRSKRNLYASRNGNARQSWNQIVPWLRQIDGRQLALDGVTFSIAPGEIG